MIFFCQTKLLVQVLFLLSALSFMQQAKVQAENKLLLKCFRRDQCSCIVNSTKPPLEMSLWPINSDLDIMSEDENWRYAVDLCHGVHMGSKANSGCQNSTVCQFNPKNKTVVFDIGRYGSAQFGTYDNVTKSIHVQYIGDKEGHVRRSINITLQCNDAVSKAEYTNFEISVFNQTRFAGIITTKAACLRPFTAPIPVKPAVSSHNSGGGLSTVYIVLIAIGSVGFLCICCFVVYAFIIKKKKSILEEEENEDYGTYSTPSGHVQDASLPSII